MAHCNCSTDRTPLLLLFFCCYWLDSVARGTALLFAVVLHLSTPSISTLKLAATRPLYDNSRTNGGNEISRGAVQEYGPRGSHRLIGRNLIGQTSSDSPSSCGGLSWVSQINKSWRNDLVRKSSGFSSPNNSVEKS